MIFGQVLKKKSISNGERNGFTPLGHRFWEMTDVQSNWCGVYRYTTYAV